MKKALASLAAIAALCTTPVLAAPPAPVPYTWTGGYIGGFGGWGWSDQSWSVPAAIPDPLFFIGSGNTNGPLGGIQVGYDFQFNRWWLVGIQGDITLGDITGNATNPNSDDGRCGFTQPGPFESDQTSNCKAHAHFWSTLTARIGFLPTENILLYVKGGVAYVGEDFNVTDIVDITGGSCGPAGTHHPNYNTTSTTYTTGTAGAGVEGRVWNNLSAFVEWDYIPGSNFGITMTNSSGDHCVPNFNANVHTGAINIVKAGLNFRIPYSP
jgi:outer membrane immunogenic protein